MPVIPDPWLLANEWILLIIATAGFGGFVHGLLRPTPVHYTLAWPFSHKQTEFGFLGDIFVGVAAGAAIFFFMDSVFGLKVDQPNELTYLKVVALGVICGYMGVSLLDRISLFIFKRLVKHEMDVERGRADLEEFRARARAASKAADLRSLADAYWRWGKDRKDSDMLDRALELFDAAIATDPKNPDNYIKKSFVYAEKAATAKDKKSLYDTAIGLTNMAIKVDKSSARAYYDRACYKHLNGAKTAEVLDDLKTAIKHNDMMRKMAKLDPDFHALHKDAQFNKIVDTETTGASLQVETVA